MIIVTCDGCARRIADDDPGALRSLPMDWCGECVTIIKTELPRLAAQAREARRAAAAEPVRQRAMRVWLPGSKVPGLRA